MCISNATGKRRKLPLSMLLPRKDHTNYEYKYDRTSSSIAKINSIGSVNVDAYAVALASSNSASIYHGTLPERQ